MSQIFTCDISRLELVSVVTCSSRCRHHPVYVRSPITPDASADLSVGVAVAHVYSYECIEVVICVVDA